MERILAISTLFPTLEMPHHGLFVFNRLKAMASTPGVDITVCNPVPTSIVHRVLPRYKAQQSVPRERKDGGMTIFHPRYHAIPGLKKDREHLSAIKHVGPFLRQLHKQKQFTQIDVHWTYPDLPLAILLSKEWGIPCSLTLRGMEAFYLDDDDSRSDIIFSHIGEVDQLISLSQEMLTVANSRSTFVGGEIVTNGADTSRFEYTDMEVARYKLGLPSRDVDILVGVGAIIERKGFHHVIDAITELNTTVRKDNPVRYYVLGSAGMEGNFEKSVRHKIATYEKQTGRTGDIVLAGKVGNAELPYWYNAATLFCLSSFGEGSPNVLTEALSCGCPAIATDVGAVPDIMARYPDSGSIIANQKDSDDAHAKKAWASVILFALEHKKTPQFRYRQADYMRNFTWDWCAQQSLRVILNRRKAVA